MSEPQPLSETFQARVTDASLDHRYVVVDSTFAARLRTEHTRTFEVSALRTPMGDETITRDVPNVGEADLESLDPQGLVTPGTPVRPGVLLVGKVTPLGGSMLNPEEKLLRTVFGKAAGNLRDSSLRAPPGCAGTVRSATAQPAHDGALATAQVVVEWERPLEVGDVLLIGEQRSTVSQIRPLDDADIAWGGGQANVRVAKLFSARDVMHARCIGPYGILLGQPLAGAKVWGGQRIEPAQAELLAEHAPWALFELLTYKSDATVQRSYTYEALVKLQNPKAGAS